MNLSDSVFVDGDKLFNLTTWKTLPLEANEEDLSQNYFLRGQEQLAIEKRLFDVEPKRVEFKTIPTWECNLRCRHCFVLHRLVRKDPGNIDTLAFGNFVQRYLEAYPSLNMARISLIGGEPFSRADKCYELLETFRDVCDKAGVPPRRSITTNGTIINADVVRCLPLLDLITVSLDGTEENHNAQRKPLDKSPVNLFQKTFDFIKRLTAAGFQDKLYVQASLTDEAYYQEHLMDLFTELVRIGVDPKQIKMGTVVSTPKNPDPQEHTMKSTREAHWVVPCCKYRFMHDFVVDSRNNVYCDYFDPDENSLLGNLWSSIEDIKAQHRKSIERVMPVLNDPKCLSCPVIGSCWGWCCNMKCLGKPSDHCDQQGLLQSIQEKASRGELVASLQVDKFRKNFRN